ncbi:hypothetical protein [Paenibacillus sp. SI8]|uniref:hypothetical protein n=1 Tax=unclassified Paenibacillus TaxID=185978 RepID=UPI003465E9F7
MKKEYVDYRLSFKNTSTKFLIVGSLRTVLSSHQTLEEANEAFDLLPQASSTPFSSIYVMCPGEEKTLDTIVSLDFKWQPEKEEVHQQSDDFFEL